MRHAWSAAPSIEKTIRSNQAKIMQKLQPHRRPQRPTNPGFGANVAALYNGAGDRYLAYADGGHDHLFDFAGLHGYADRQLWSLLQGKLADLRSGGAAAIRILDAGCGPGTWLRRCVAYARRIGFSEITARGFDLAQAQVETARLLSDGRRAELRRRRPHRWPAGTGGGGRHRALPVQRAEPPADAAIAQLEESCATDPVFIERGMHLLLVGKQQRQPAKQTSCLHRSVDLPQGAIAAE